MFLTCKGVGKSSIMLRFVTGNFSEESEPTLGGAFMAKLFPYKEKNFKYQVLESPHYSNTRDLGYSWPREISIFSSNVLQR